VFTANTPALFKFKGNFTPPLIYSCKSVTYTIVCFFSLFSPLNAQDIDSLYAEMQITSSQEERSLMIWLSIVGGAVLLLALATFFFLWRWTVQKKHLADRQIKQLEQEKQLIATQAVLNGEAQERIRVAIVDDHKIIVGGLESLINESGIARITGKAYSVAGCLELLKENQPEVLLLDVSMPDGNGIDLCPKIKAKHPHVKVMILTSYGELATITRALDAGADGYVLKKSLPEELLEGIRTVASGERFLCEDANRTLQKNESNPMELSRREMELLQLIAEGYTLPQQADKMCLGINTIRGYRQRLNIKLNAHNTAQLLQNAKTLMLV
jgi:DNA-binding NarL/FixJ family response regulator